MIPPEKEFDLERARSLVDAEDRAGLQAYIAELPPPERARLLSRLDEERRGHLLEVVTTDFAGTLLEAFGEAQSVELLEGLDPKTAAAIVQELPSNEQADLLVECDEEFSNAVLDAMSRDEASETRGLMAYPWDTAGGMMITEYLAFPVSKKVGDLVEDLRRNRDAYADYDIQYVYVTEGDGVLRGVIRLRDLLLARGSDSIASVMIKDPVSVRADAGLHELYEFFHAHSFLGVPVVDDRGRILGVLTRAAVDEAVSEEATENFLKISGLQGEEEIRTMPLFFRSRRRLSWLSINIVLNFLAASVIAVNQDTLEQVIALAVFLPIISDMSGCSGNQAVGVSIRELTLGLIKPTEFLRVFFKESSLGLVNGCVLGLLVATAGAVWQADVLFGVVVGSALMLNTTLSVCIGGLVPLVLKSRGQDPALASGPILTTLTDMCGFFLTLFFASQLLI